MLISSFKSFSPFHSSGKTLILPSNPLFSQSRKCKSTCKCVCEKSPGSCVSAGQPRRGGGEDRLQHFACLCIISKAPGMILSGKLGLCCRPGRPGTICSPFQNLPGHVMKHHVCSLFGISHDASTCTLLVCASICEPCFLW